FRNVILCMTTNAGAADIAKPALGFGREQRHDEDNEAINRMFAPEFRNRLDAIIKFASLGPESMGRVVDKFVAELEVQLADRKVFIELTDGARRWLAEKGYDKLFGARPLARVIQEYVKKPLAEEVLFGKLSDGGTVRVDVDGLGDTAKLVFTYLPPERGALPPASQEPVLAE
ncbi:AAA family ATPase, partial [Reyranella sp.]|uniref:AAA family ATPase n=1 Tax=Reyranella sp. TaxID=1929291 RepID=UPI003F6F1426